MPRLPWLPEQESLNLPELRLVEPRENLTCLRAVCEQPSEEQRPVRRTEAEQLNVAPVGDGPLQGVLVEVVSSAASSSLSGKKKPGVKGSRTSVVAPHSSQMQSTFW